MNKKSHPYSRQYIDQEDINAVSEVLKQDIITRGKSVENLEKAILEYCGAQYAIAFCNGTAALKAAYFAANISPHDIILTTPNTFIATVTAALSLEKSKIKFIDTDINSGNLNLNLLKQAIREYKTSQGKKIIVPVHYAGNPIDMQKLESMVKEPSTFIIEDAAQALGASYGKNGPKVGSCEWSDITIFSLHPTKSITSGEGGIVTTNCPILAQKLRLFRNNGITHIPKDQKNPSEEPWYYEAQAITGNYNISEIHASLGLSQFKKLDTFVKKRRKILSWYNKELSGNKVIIPLTTNNESYGTGNLCPILIDFEKLKINRQKLMQKLLDNGIQTQVHYIPLYRQPIFNLPKEIKKRFPQEEKFYSQVLSFPVSFLLERKDITKICKILTEIISQSTHIK